MEVVHELVALQHDDLEVAVITAPEIALDDRRRPRRMRRDHLAARPRQIDVRVVVEVVHELVALQHDDLEVAVIPAPEIALNDRRRPRRMRRDHLAARPRQIDVRVVVEVVHELVALQHDDLEVAVIAAPEIALNDRRRPRRTSA